MKDAFIRVCTSNIVMKLGSESVFPRFHHNRGVYLSSILTKKEILHIDFEANRFFFSFSSMGKYVSFHSIKTNVHTLHTSYQIRSNKTCGKPLII